MYPYQAHDVFSAVHDPEEMYEYSTTSSAEMQAYGIGASSHPVDNTNAGSAVSDVVGVSLDPAEGSTWTFRGHNNNKTASRMDRRVRREEGPNNLSLPLRHPPPAASWHSPFPTPVDNMKTPSQAQRLLQPQYQITSPSTYASSSTAVVPSPNATHHYAIYSQLPQPHPAPSLPLSPYLIQHQHNHAYPPPFNPQSSNHLRPTPSASSPPSNDDDSDQKRLRNTAASARFRAKKKQREQSLERAAREKRDRLRDLETRIGELEVENKWLRELIWEIGDGEKGKGKEKEGEEEVSKDREEETEDDQQRGRRRE